MRRCRVALSVDLVFWSASSLPIFLLDTVASAYSSDKSFKVQRFGVRFSCADCSMI